MSLGRRSGSRGLFLALAVVITASGARAETAPSRTTYPTAAVEEGTWQSRSEVQGRVRAWSEQEIAAPFALRVRRVRVELGQEVRAGAVLAEIEVPELQALLGEFSEAERLSALAQERARDAERRLETRFATRGEVLQAQSAQTEAKARADRAWAAASEALLALGQPVRREELLARLEAGPSGSVAPFGSVVRAPSPGRVAAVEVAAGVQVAKDAVLFRLEDLSRVYVEVEVPLEEVAVWQRGSVSLVSPSGAEEPLRLASGSPSVDRATGLAKLRYEAVNRRGLVDGQWVRVALSGAGHRVLWVPEAAVVARSGRTYCVVKRDDKYESAPVKVGPARDGRVPVLQGLAPGDRVVTEGAYELLYRDLNQLMTPAD